MCAPTTLSCSMAFRSLLTTYSCSKRRSSYNVCCSTRQTVKATHIPTASGNYDT